METTKRWNQPKVMAYLCAEIATSSRSIAKILKKGYGKHTLPSVSCVMAWLAADVSLQDQYARAKGDQADFLADEMLDIADDAANDFMEREGEQTAGWVLNGEHVQRSRLRIDTRKWLAGKLRPKKWGGVPDNVQVPTTYHINLVAPREPPPEPDVPADA
jgi:hypothetical protein